LSDFSTKEEESVTLMCELSKAMETVSWMKNGKPLTLKEKNKYKISVDGTKHTLVIPKSETGDSANFSCSVKDIKTIGKVDIKGTQTSLH